MATTALKRSRKYRMFGGVCGGIAEKYGIEPWKVRLLAVVSCVLPGPQVVLYALLWVLLPEDD